MEGGNREHTTNPQDGLLQDLQASMSYTWSDSGCIGHTVLGYGDAPACSQSEQPFGKSL